MYDLPAYLQAKPTESKYWAWLAFIAEDWSQPQVILSSRCTQGGRKSCPLPASTAVAMTEHSNYSPIVDSSLCSLQMHWLAEYFTGLITEGGGDNLICSFLKAVVCSA